MENVFALRDRYKLYLDGVSVCGFMVHTADADEYGIVTGLAIYDSNVQGVIPVFYSQEDMGNLLEALRYRLPECYGPEFIKSVKYFRIVGRFAQLLDENCFELATTESIELLRDDSNDNADYPATLYIKGKTIVYYNGTECVSLNEEGFDILQCELFDENSFNNLFYNPSVKKCLFYVPSKKMY